MIEHDVERALQDLAEVHVRQEAPADVREDARLVPLTTVQQRSWLAHSPRWRFRSMFSATKFVVAGAIVALFGGYLLVAQPFDQQRATVPGAATDDSAPEAAVVSGHFESISHIHPEGSWYGMSPDGLTLHYRGEMTDGQAVMSDARLSGVVTGTLESDVWEPFEDVDCDGSPDAVSTCVAIYWGTLSIENDDGTWSGRWVRQFGEPQGVQYIELVGTGAYEGWSAILSTTGEFPLAGSTNTWSVSGTVFPGNLPPDREALPPEK